MKKQPKAWIDFKHENNNITVGIECDDPSLTFDGHFICLFPCSPEEKDATEAMKRAEELLKYMRGEKQFQRS